MIENPRGFEIYKRKLSVYSPAECAKFYNHILNRPAVVYDETTQSWCVIEDEVYPEVALPLDEIEPDTTVTPHLVFQTHDVAACQTRLQGLEQHTGEKFITIAYQEDLKGDPKGTSSPFIIGRDSCGNDFQIHNFDRLFRF